MSNIFRPIRTDADLRAAVTLHQTTEGLYLDFKCRLPRSASAEATDSYLRSHGKPVAFYSDKASIFRVNKKDVKGGDGFTQFGRAMHDLNIDSICANTPAAKGRVERANQTLQDRLVKELRLRAISDREQGNAYLPAFMADYNRRFAREPMHPHDAHRPLLAHENLARVFTWQEERRLTDNLTLHYKRMMYIGEQSPAADAARGKRVAVIESEDGAVRLEYRGQELVARAFAKDARVSKRRWWRTSCSQAPYSPSRQSSANATSARFIVASSRCERRTCSENHWANRGRNTGVQRHRSRLPTATRCSAERWPGHATSPPPSRLWARVPNHAPSRSAPTTATGSGSVPCGPQRSGSQPAAHGVSAGTAIA